MSKIRSVLVTGATGQQGGAVASALLGRGHTVRALTRNPESEAALKLKDRGAEVVKGDFDNHDSLVAAMAGVDAVFAMGTMMEAGLDAELRQGRALVDAASEADVGHFVYTSVASADKKTGIPHFDSKFAVEEHLRDSGLSYTIIAPVYFMENFFFPQSYEAFEKQGAYASPLPEDIKLQQIAVEDIGEFGAFVIEERGDFFGRRIELASDDLTGEEVVGILSDVADRKINYYRVSMDDIRAMSEDLAIMYEWFISTGYSVDIEGLRERYPSVIWHRFGDWALEQKFATAKAC